MSLLTFLDDESFSYVEPEGDLYKENEDDEFFFQSNLPKLSNELLSF